jgi:hypothetical protein
MSTNKILFPNSSLENLLKSDNMLAKNVNKNAPIPKFCPEGKPVFKARKIYFNTA